MGRVILMSNKIISRKGSSMLLLLFTTTILGIVIVGLMQYHAVVQVSAERHTERLQSFYWQDAQTRLTTWLVGERIVNGGKLGGTSLQSDVASQVYKNTPTDEIKRVRALVLAGQFDVNSLPQVFVEIPAKTVLDSPWVPFLTF
jgi:hypothetical protein